MSGSPVDLSQFSIVFNCVISFTPMCSNLWVNDRNFIWKTVEPIWVSGWASWQAVMIRRNPLDIERLQSKALGFVKPVLHKMSLWLQGYGPSLSGRLGCILGPLETPRLTEVFQLLRISTIPIRMGKCFEWKSSTECSFRFALLFICALGSLSPCWLGSPLILSDRHFSLILSVFSS